ncbi:MAG: N-acetylmuramoyl-L-alanine amidase [Fimbriimonadales bacterium]|jgi:hypothetical protein|nr:N-acetylmuramoyl-L-alanine amidase [Fimbriimonadales bacterium]CUU02445.1 Ig-like domain-containing protein [Armatimonadetes bacterium GBS]CUU36181.1 Ig-like domain-containing protein [Armatimonadetes bacterium DC]CUU36965.1 Ig-like domain-containing protein [Armatimonadetes bacterium GXS]
MRIGCLIGVVSLLSVSLAQPDYPGARWVPAYSGNYTASNRPSTYPIRYVIVHVTQGSYSGTISWFQNPSARVSAHYVLRSSDGEITQMVRHKDIAWHAGNWTYNTQSIGLEHEGWVNDPRWFTTAMYRSSANLTRYICDQYGIPKTRSYIIGHNEVPGATHTDPGPYWDWNYYMSLVAGPNASYAGATFPSTIRPGEQLVAVVRFNNTGGVTWSPSGTNPVRLGTANPRDRSSPFYTAGNWISANRPTAVDATTAPGSTGSFSFVLTGPRSYGTYTESYQLVQEGITWFGPVVSFTLQVVPWDIVIDNTSSQFSVSGSWTLATMATDKYGANYYWTSTNPSSTAYARWFLNAPIDGAYDVYAWWSQGTNRSTQARYEIAHASGTTAVVVNQQTNGGRWVYLGRFQFPKGGGNVYLRATAPSGYVVIADAVRIVGPY